MGDWPSEEILIARVANYALLFKSIDVWLDFKVHLYGSSNHYDQEHAEYL